jgi:hypothetical protein
VQVMYSSLCELRNASDNPPARTAWRVLGSDVASVCNSARKRWTQEAFADADERGRLRDRIRREVVQLHAVVVAQGPHEAARRRCEAALVEAGEADDIVERWVGNSVPLRRHDLLCGLPIHIRRQLTAGHQQVQRQHRRRRALPCRRVDDGDGLLGSHTDGRGNKEREARTALERERKGKNGSGAEAQEAGMANAKCKGKKPPLLRLLDL